MVSTLLGRKLFHVETVDSTQDRLREELDRGAPDGSIVLADRQNAGRGRQGREWIDLGDEQLFMSLALRPPIAPAKFPLVNIAAGIALCSALETLGVKNPGIKWPNDVWLDGKKVAGILAEVHRGLVLLGVGVNLRGQALPHELQDIATTLQMHSAEVDRWKLIPIFCHELEQTLTHVKSRGPKELQEAFRKRWIFADRPIQITEGSEVLYGRAQEIDEDGALLLHPENSESIRRVLSGDVLPRGTVAGKSAP